MNPSASQIEERIQALESEIAERQELLRAYKSVAKDMKLPVPINGSDLGMPQGESPQANTSWQSENTTGAVRKALLHMGPQFTLNHVVSWLKHNGFNIDRQKVSFVLSRLAQKRQIGVVEKGKGQRPTMYATSPVIAAAL